MCTAINDGNLFGRTLDADRSYGEQVAVTPKNIGLGFLYEEPMTCHFAMIGIACRVGDKPLYFDATNEWGLSAAGLNFPKNAVYHKPIDNKYNVASFELIPWLLGGCRNVKEAVKKLRSTNITNDNFSESIPSTPLHWIVADKNSAVTVESPADGLQIYENPVGVLTNNPPFPYHIYHLTEYMHLTSHQPDNTLCPKAELDKYCGGLGGIGLPGDFTSTSRFVKAVFLKNHTTREAEKTAEINRFFHIMGGVSVPKGCVKTDSGREWQTVYTACADRASFSYHFTTYANRQIRSISGNTDCDNIKFISIY